MYRILELNPQLQSFSGDIDLNGLLLEIIEANIRITGVNCHEPSFEDYYLEMTGGKK